MSAKRKALHAIPLILLVSGCNDILGFQEGKPYPEGGIHSDGSVSDASDADGRLEESSVDATSPDAPDANTVPIDGGDAGCATPACGGCIDVSTNTKNCGSCGHDCGKLLNVATPGAVTCSAGKCVVPNAACATGFGHCSANPDDGCETDLTLPSHCGTCTTTCPTTTPLCTSTGCKSSCPMDAPTSCAGTCADLMSDVNHCNDCATPCPSAGAKGTRHCVGGQCKPTCNDGSPLCNNQCPDYDNDPKNCGTCDHSCGSGVCLSKLCCAQGQINANGLCCAPGQINANGICCGAGQINSNGKCCPTGQTNCGGTCVNTTNDDLHCGGCSACSSLQKCTASVCLARDGQTCAAHSDCASGVCTTFYRDMDGDGHGSPAVSKALKLCGAVSPPQGYAAMGDDCCDDDGSDQTKAAKIHPGQTTYFMEAAGVCGVNFDYDCDGKEITDQGIVNGMPVDAPRCLDSATCVTGAISVTAVCGTNAGGTYCYQHPAGMSSGVCSDLTTTCASCPTANGFPFRCK